MIDRRTSNSVEEFSLYLDKLRRGVRLCWILIGFACLLGGVSIILSEVYNSAALHKIQQQRKDVCIDQNRRHDATIRQFYKEVALYLKQNPKDTVQVRASLKANLRIVNALVPTRDCDNITQLPS